MGVLTRIVLVALLAASSEIALPAAIPTAVLAEEQAGDCVSANIEIHKDTAADQIVQVCLKNVRPSTDGGYLVDVDVTANKAISYNLEFNATGVIKKLPGGDLFTIIKNNSSVNASQLFPLLGKKLSQKAETVKAAVPEQD